jgi:anthranilate synthase component 1
MPWCSDLLGLVALDTQRYPALMESAATGSPLAKFDIVPAFPGDSLELDGSGVLRGSHAGSDGFLAAFDEWFQGSREAAHASDLPFTGGWFLFLGYELAGHIEPTVPVIPDRDGFPRALALRCPAAVIRDHARRCVWLVAEPGHESLLDEMARDLQAAPVVQAGTAAVCRPAVEDPPGQFVDGVARILDYIREGDVFQVNLSRQWRAPLAANTTALEVYARLRDANPAPFAGIACLGERWILSSSPERLFSVREGVVNTRPIAGTHPRGQDPADDAALSRALIAHPKERAEHIMLIDLERNDLGRVCVAGSVEVNELMVLETYSHVHHIVSNVRGRLRPGTTPGEVIRATFPGGTITGCPKVRCMQIIAELEGVGRGPYTGSFGYVNIDGSGDTNILIRTLGVAHGEISLRAGGGIVADSKADRELDETRHKARGPLRALGLSP